MNETCQCLAGESYYSNQSSLASSAKHHGSKASSLHELVANATTNGTMPIEECLPYVPDVFMFSVILFFFTFIIAFGLKMLRHSPFFPTKVGGRNPYEVACLERGPVPFRFEKSSPISTSQ